jgi:aspartyl-tRNA(Asn)/glutamyl-tRNA(Gln) amidotransferase subunit A
MEMLNKSLGELSEALTSRAISSEEITKACLKHVASCDTKLGSMLWIDEEKALKEAQASDLRRSKNQACGVLDGVPLSIKDMILCKGLPATAASKILEGYMPCYEATVIEKLRSEGAVVLGKANQDEFAMGSSNESSAYKICKNPYDHEYTPGGSSGGSAASVSAGMCFGSLGTDTGGSIRQPAAFCGVVGVKPSYGRVSRFGVIAFASSLDQVGPLTRTVRDSALLLRAIAGHDPRDATSVREPVPDYVSELNLDLKNKKIGVPREYFAAGISESVKASLMRSIDILRQEGAEIVDISLPHTPYAVATYYIIAAAEASSNLSKYDGIRFGPRVGDNADLLSLYELTRGELFGDEVKRRIMLGTFVLSAGHFDAYYVRAQKVRRLFANDFAEAFKKVDVIISPTTPTTAFKIGEKIGDPVSMYLNDIYTISANLAGLCSISLPSGLDNLGLPIGTQLMARPFDEQGLFNIAAALEAGLAFEQRPLELCHE